MAYDFKINVKHDPFIMRMAHHSVAMPEFRQQMADLMKQGKAFEVVVDNKMNASVHPTEQLLDAFYCAMGLK